MWNNYYRAVTENSTHDAPMSREYPYYVLAEAEGADPDADEERFLNLLHAGMGSGDVVDTVLPKSAAERDALWQVREEFEPALPAYLYDISLPMRNMETYAERLKAGLGEWRDDADGLVFGHIADGNLHIFVRPHDEGGNKERSDSIVYGCLDGLDGSVSAEHGIGIEKKEWLPQSRTPGEIELMRGMKRLLDPENILNPGKIVG
jgi:FAD/FMN-containing dehydrogenase